MDNVDCVGTEASITECQFNGWGQHNCTDRPDAGVICDDCKYIYAYHQFCRLFCFVVFFSLVFLCTCSCLLF